jgi:hypothetical protein
MMALRAGCIASLLSISLIACQGAATNDAAQSDLVGAWGLVSWRVTSSGGETTYPFGETPEGQIIYSATGQMSAQLMYPGAGIGDLSGLDQTEAILRVSRTFFAYYGTYSVDPIARTVTHHVQGSLRPSWVGTDQLRGFELLDDDRMALTVVLGDAASSDTNFPGSNILMWERLR